MTENFDHVQSPRLGQRVPYEGTTVRMFNGEELPEVSVPGQIIFRKDSKILQVYNDVEGGWENVSGGIAGLLTYVGPIPPPAPPAKEGDTWYDSDDMHRQYVHNGEGWVLPPVGMAALEPEVATAISDGVNARIDTTQIKLLQRATHFLY